MDIYLQMFQGKKSMYGGSGDERETHNSNDKATRFEQINLGI